MLNYSPWQENGRKWPPLKAKESHCLNPTTYMEYVVSLIQRSVSAKLKKALLLLLTALLLK